MSTLGFRRWRVSTGGDLVGLGVPQVWEPGRQVAVCRGLEGAGFGNCAPFRVWPDHPVPAMRSRCGIWAHKAPIRPCLCGDPGSPTHGAVGVVRLWGRYVEHETGWRAQYAQVVALVDCTGRVRADHPAPRYPDLDTLYGEWAAGTDGWARGEPDVWCDPTLLNPGPITVLQFAVQAGAEVQRAARWAADAFRAEVLPRVQQHVDRATRHD